MKKKCFNYFICTCLLLNSFVAKGQDSTIHYTVTLDTSWYHKIYTVRIGGFNSYILDHNPEKADLRRVRQFERLVDQQPTKKNYILYSNLAASLWEVGKIDSAALMCSTIINSNERFYTSDYYNGSDIPGDTTTNLYGYGSFTSNYKNYAAICLTKIFLEKERYDSALVYLDKAVNQYPVVYNCGTGHQWQKDEYDFLYACCYKGSHNDKALLDLLLADDLEKGNDFTIPVLKRIYSQQDIMDSLLSAMNSIEVKADTIGYKSTEGTYDKKGKEIITDTYLVFPAEATMTLFDRKIQMSLPETIKNRPPVKDDYLKAFKASSFYAALVDEDKEG